MRSKKTYVHRLTAPMDATSRDHLRGIPRGGKKGKQSWLAKDPKRGRRLMEVSWGGVVLSWPIFTMKGFLRSFGDGNRKTQG